MLAIRRKKLAYKKSKKEDEKYKQLRNYGALSGIGVLFFSSVVVGYLLGNFLDKKFGTEPWCVVIFVTLGSVAAFIEMLKLVKSTEK